MTEYPYVTLLADNTVRQWLRQQDVDAGLYSRPPEETLHQLAVPQAPPTLRYPDPPGPALDRWVLVDGVVVVEDIP